MAFDICDFFTFILAFQLAQDNSILCDKVAQVSFFKFVTFLPKLYILKCWNASWIKNFLSSFAFGFFCLVFEIAIHFDWFFNNLFRQDIYEKCRWEGIFFS